jgi:glycosyltransferase involved in cell wall biosynthesis
MDASNQPCPLVSILMPAYNAADYLRQAVASVQQQTYPHWELIIANDGSTDNTLAVAQALAASDARITVLHHATNTGSFAAMRNAAMAVSQGQYIANLDSDDEFEPDALAVMVQYLEQHPQCPMVYGGYGNMTADSQPYKHQLQGVVWADTRFVYDPANITRPSDFHMLDEHTWFNVLTGRVDNHVQAMMFKKTALQQLGPWDERMGYYADVDLVFRAYAAWFTQIHALPHVVFRYRIAATGNLSNNGNTCLNRVSQLLYLYDTFFTRFEGTLDIAKPVKSKVYRINLTLLALTAARNQQWVPFAQILGKLWQSPHIHYQDAFLGTVKTLIRLTRR